MRGVFDRFLAKFPLFFGYWKKYADLEFSIAGTEAAELVYERGIAGIHNSVDLWTHYCAFKVETSHDPEAIREFVTMRFTLILIGYLKEEQVMLAWTFFLMFFGINTWNMKSEWILAKG